jgi:hypothetical protein
MLGAMLISLAAATQARGETVLTMIAEPKGATEICVHCDSKATTVLGTVWLMMVACILFSGCTSSSTGPIERESGLAVHGVPTIPRSGTFALLDAHILNLVLEDLLGNSDFHTYPSGIAGSKLVVWEETKGASVYISDSQLSSELRTAPRLPGDLSDDLGSRNWKRTSLRTFQPTNPKILVGPEVKVLSDGNLPPDPKELDLGDPFEKKYPDARGYISFWLPSYSRDGTMVLVRFGFGPTAHGACGTYILEKVGDTWRVKWRYLAYYA